MKKLMILAAVAMIAMIAPASAVFTVTLTDETGTPLPSLVTQRIGVTETYGLVMSEDFIGENVRYGVVSQHSNLTIEILADGEYYIADSNSLRQDNVFSVKINEGSTPNKKYIGTIGVYLEGESEPSIQFEITPIASASQGFSGEIPEFPTVALPVAAILGLAFFMQRRKEE